MDFTFYKIADKEISEPRVVCQINSLSRISRNFDIIIIDEAKDFCNYLCSSHLAENSPIGNNEKFYDLIFNSVKIFLLDADLDINIYFFFRNIIVMKE